MSISRRQFLIFMGGAAGSIACGLKGASQPSLAFEPVKLPLPLTVDGVPSAEQAKTYRAYTVVDDLVVPTGYTYDVIAAWGDPVGKDRFGYNNDFVSFVPTAAQQGLLTVNFEYISLSTWGQTYAAVMGTELPLATVQAALQPQGGRIHALTLPDQEALKQQILTLTKAALQDQGLGIIAVRQTAKGLWERNPGDRDRRITGLSGLDDGQYLRSTGPAVAVFTKANKQGYDDRLADQIIGTFGNCAGGTTPWGTAISAEENFQAHVPEPVYADGSSFDPSENPFQLTQQRLSGLGNPLGLAGNKYGWIVEVDPSNPQDPGTKHTWLGRYRHEAVAVRAVAQKPLAVYSGCDRIGGHLYKFVSAAPVTNITDKANSKLLEAGMLYGAQLNADGTGRWIPLAPETPVNPVRPSQVLGGALGLPHPARDQGGVARVTDDEAAALFQAKFATLGDLYRGTPIEQQGAILIDAHYAANAAGVTCTARPEDTTVDAKGALYIAFTSGAPDKSLGGPDAAIFKGPQGQIPHLYGWIMKLTEADNDPAALTFRWEMIAAGGDPAAGGLGFANPDNLEIDPAGDLWMVTDMSGGFQNQALPPQTIAQVQGGFGNNAAWYLPLQGPSAGQAFPFAIGPMECELCGLVVTPNHDALFLTVQHPGEGHGQRQDRQIETRTLTLRTTEGSPFTQTRQVPIGSNWPGLGPNDPPKPALVVIRRQQGGTLV